MTRHRNAAFGLASGLVFAVGLVLSGMTDPARVLAFLDFTGEWDPRLALVMVGAIGVHFSWLRLAPRVLRHSEAPASSSIPPSSSAPQAPVTRSLVLGAAIFGVGWGLAGYCPGPAVVSVGLGSRDGALFFLAMLAGMLLFKGYAAWRARNQGEVELAEAVPSCR